LEQEILKKRLYDLAKKSYNSSCFTFTDFLTPAEVSDFYGIANDEIFKGYTVFGGFDNAERVMIRFGNADEFGYEVDFPINILKVEPLIKKFSDDLNHRDFLGAIMNLGIARETIGDIILKNNTAYVMVSEKMTAYIIENLSRIRHTSVRVIQDNEADIDGTLELVEKRIIASSCRIDGVLSKLLNVSRTESIEIFREKRVFVNSRLCENNSYQLKNGDVVSVRGYGKFIFDEVGGITRSGRYNIYLRVYA